MANTTHAYDSRIIFDEDSFSKEKFDELLDQVKTLDIEEYNEDAKDGFRECVNYWNERTHKAFNHKIQSNRRRISNL